MNNIFKKIWDLKSVIRYLPKTIWFNFHYLPFNQAIKLPIYVYKMKVVNSKGTILINAPQIRRGMIWLGFNKVSVYPNTGISWDNHGGTIVFNGTCEIGNDSFVSFGKNTRVEFGDKFVASAAWKCISYRGMTFGDEVRFGWECLIMDTNIHSLYDLNTKKFRKTSSPVTIGNNNWFGAHCKVMHGVKTLDRCIFGMNTVVTRGCEMKSYCVMGGSPVKVLTENVIRIIDQDELE